MAAKTVYRKGVPGTIVHVKASERFVPREYPGNDPRTRAARRGGR